jgi:hypothetical protein
VNGTFHNFDLPSADSSIQNSMYTGAMEPFCLIGVYPLGWGVGWAVTRKQGVGQLSKAEELEAMILKP